MAAVPGVEERRACTEAGPRARTSALIPEFTQQVARHGLERRYVLGRHLRPPVAHPRRRRLRLVLMLHPPVIAKRLIHVLVVVEHRRLELQIEPRRELAQLLLGLSNERLVSDLAIPPGPQH